ncbi:MAG TPA: NADH-quinone oxidoreductase subunit A [Tepidisphaeraceae bacterium]|nr:NADH-quinone oxidoreductase subunit A [Tepidisphaeraceae bacterium]
MHCLLAVASEAPPIYAPVSSWAPIVLMIVIAVGFAVVNLAASIIVGPSRTGAIKEQTYESGMVPFGDARRRFNVRFYIVAMIFLVFDVDIIFFYPWATIYAPAVHHAAQSGGVIGGGGAILLDMVVFIVILLVAYIYAWGKGVFRWD